METEEKLNHEEYRLIENNTILHKSSVDSIIIRQINSLGKERTMIRFLIMREELVYAIKETKDMDRASVLVDVLYWLDCIIDYVK